MIFLFYEIWTHSPSTTSKRSPASSTNFLSSSGDDTPAFLPIANDVVVWNDDVVVVVLCNDCSNGSGSGSGSCCCFEVTIDEVAIRVRLRRNILCYTYFYFCESWKHFNIQFKEMKDVEVQGKAIFEKVI